MPTIARHTHLYVIGTTGSGKSKFLESLIVGDVLAGRGVGLVDPHTDLARDVVSHLATKGFFRQPESRQRIIYFDPTRSDYFLPFNVLRSEQPAYEVAQSVIEAFRRTWPKALEEAPRFTNIALAALLVLIATRQTLVALPDLLTKKQYREELLAQVKDTDPQLVDYFHTRFDQWGRETPVMIESVLNKVTAFSFNPHLRRLLGASENRLNFRKIMDEGQVLLVDLGRCDGETRRLIGSLVVTGMEQAALTRKEDQARRPFYFYMDEFQDFCANDGATKTLAQILSECRKFGLFLHLAHQTLGQLQQRLISALGNVGIKIAFNTDREDAEVMARKLFSVNTTEIKHDAQTEAQHPLFAPLPEQWERWVGSIQNLRPRIAWVKERGKPAVRIRTDNVPPYRVSPSEVDALKQVLAQTHGVLAGSAESGGSAQGIPLNVFTPMRLKDWELPRPTQAILAETQRVIFSAGEEKEIASWAS